jgi:hypothetical protein
MADCVVPSVFLHLKILQNRSWCVPLVCLAVSPGSHAENELPSTGVFLPFRYCPPGRNPPGEAGGTQEATKNPGYVSKPMSLLKRTHFNQHSQKTQCIGKLR